MNARDKAVHSATPGLQPDANPGRGPSTSSMPAIRVEGLGKEYVIGSRESVPRTFREMLGGAFSAPLRRLRRLRGQVGKEERFWALQDVSFEIAPGEVVGIIGRNGAGKSTLLKILSRITEPTRGRVEIRGRVSSLLEVGTGFHPELTGRENIYLNGAILGMMRREIDRKFDEIVAFAESEKFLDTAVKYYSSGMYVRLAFAVAAHLEPEVLLIDEVLAVGDVKFQKKCLDLLRESTYEGRTVLFVSHNMSAVRSLCSRCIILHSGRVASDSPPNIAVERYLIDGASSKDFVRESSNDGRPTIIFGRIGIQEGNSAPLVRIELGIHSQYECALNVDVRLHDGVGNPIAFGSLVGLGEDRLVAVGGADRVVTIEFLADFMADGRYIVSLDLSIPAVEYLDRVEHCLAFELSGQSRVGERRLAQDWGFGSFRIPLHLAASR